MRSSSLAVVALVLGLFLGGCAAMHYSPYEGHNIRKGSGGTKTVVDGVELWRDGTPPRKYKVLGIVTDRRGADPIAQAFFDSTLAKQVKKVGGDAAIILSGQSFYSGSSYSNGTSTATYQNVTKAAVVKYLSE